MGITEVRKLLAEAPVVASVACQIEQFIEKTTKTGKPYLEWKLRDRDGSFSLKIWDNQPGFSQLREMSLGRFVVITGQWELSEYGMEARSWTCRELSEEERGDLLAGGSAEIRIKQELDGVWISEVLGTINDPRLRVLTARVWDDPKLGPHYRRAAAAREFHHARRGGLVEHVAQMLRAANAIAEVYPSLHRDLFLAGVFFHDVGKLWETCPPDQGLEIPIDLWGEMMGHISLGVEFVNFLWHEMMKTAEAEGWKDLKPRNEEVRRHLLHLIASHHGELEWGSPVLPKTPEAVALHYVDNLDAKLEMFARGYETSPEVAAGVLAPPKPLRQKLIRPLTPVEWPVDEGSEG